MQKSKIQLILSLLLSVYLQSCSQKIPKNPDSSPVSHKNWDQLLQIHVNKEGWVDYQGFRQNQDMLDMYLDLLSQNLPNPNTWSEHEQLAYWINLYNAFTINLILDHYPVQSIKDIGNSIQIPFINSVFDLKFIPLGGKMYDLNFIEHGILRKKFDEARIHFAINCASVSCPPLLNQAFRAEILDQQLNQQAEKFLQDTLRNQITTDEIKLSKIFKWFKGDFTRNGSLQSFIDDYVPEKINQNASISWLDYNWKLNSIKTGAHVDIDR